MGYDTDTLAVAKRKAIELMEETRREYQTDRTPVVSSGCIGPRGDGYVPGRTMSTQEAETYHLEQIKTLAATSADMVCAMTMNYMEEAIGVARAARQAGMPVYISFTVETDVWLPTSQPLKSAIEQVDDQTAGYPTYYMINCAHPIHFGTVLTAEEPLAQRILGLRANASRMSHPDLDEVTELDPGDPAELGQEYAQLKTRLKHLRVFGRCCGTDIRHIEQIANAALPLFRDPN